MRAINWDCVQALCFVVCEPPPVDTPFEGAQRGRTHSLTHSPHSLTHSRTDELTHSLTHELTNSRTHELTHSRTPAHETSTHSLSHSVSQHSLSNLRTRLASVTRQVSSTQTATARTHSLLTRRVSAVSFTQATTTTTTTTRVPQRTNSQVK